MASSFDHPSFDRRHALKLLGAGGVGLVLTACSGNDTSSSAATSTTALTAIGNGATTSGGF